MNHNDRHQPDIPSVQPEKRLWNTRTEDRKGRMRLWRYQTDQNRYGTWYQRQVPQYRFTQCNCATNEDKIPGTWYKGQGSCRQQIDQHRLTQSWNSKLGTFIEE